jgi:acetyl esterase/lipase
VNRIINFFGNRRIESSDNNSHPNPTSNTFFLGKMSKRLSREDYGNFPSVSADFRLSYGTEADQFGDLYLPSGDGPHPVVILLHGGCWRNHFGLEPLGRVAEYLQQVGIAVWNLEYQRLGQGGGWPTTMQDVARGADHLRLLAKIYPLDLSQVIAVGHSAGGHLGLWLGARSHLPSSSEIYFPDPLPLKGILSLAGVADLVRGVAWDVCQGACVELMGGSPEVVPERYQQASPCQMGPVKVPSVHLVGEYDEIVRAKMVQEDVFELRKQAAEVSIDLEVIPEIGHFELVDPTSPVWPIVEKAIKKLLLAV